MSAAQVTAWILLASIALFVLRTAVKVIRG